MRRILLNGVFGGLPSLDLAIHVHVPEALSRMVGDGSERDKCKVFWGHVLEAFFEHGI